MPPQGVKKKSGWDSAAHFAVATVKRAAAFGSKARHVLVLAASALALRCPFARLPLVPAFRCLLVIVGQSKGLTGGLAPHASAIDVAPGPSSTAPPAAVAAASSPPKSPPRSARRRHRFLRTRVAHLLVVRCSRCRLVCPLGGSGRIYCSALFRLRDQGQRQSPAKTTHLTHAGKSCTPGKDVRSALPRLVNRKFSKAG